MSDESRAVAEILRDAIKRGRERCRQLEKLDIDKLVAAGTLKPLRGRWFEFDCNIHDLPEGLTYLATEVATGRNGKHKIKLGDRDAMLKVLRQY